MGHILCSPENTPDSFLSRYQICCTEDIDEAVDCGERIFCENRIHSGDSRFKAQIFYRRLNSIGIGRMGFGCDTQIDVSPMEKFTLIQMPFRGQEFITSGGHNSRCTPTQGVILNAQQRIQIQHFSGTEKLIMRVDQDLMRKICQQHLGRTLKKDLQFQPEMPLTTSQGRAWMQMTGWIYELLSTDTALPKILRAQLEHSVATTLLACQPHTYSAELCEDDVQSIAPSYIKRVEQYIEEHAHEPITVTDMAEYAGVSTRTLFVNFRRFRNTSPMNYLKEIRLRRVREDLQRADPIKGAVTNIAYRWGFSHLGHFTTDYKRRFGETPSETLGRQ